MEIPKEVLEAYKRYSAIYGEPGGRFPYGTEPHNFGGRHCEMKADGTMALVGTDRGRETKRLETKSVDELMYWIFKSRARSIAFHTPHPGLDHAAKQQIALDEMGKISPEWRDRLKREQDASRGWEIPKPDWMGN